MADVPWEEPKKPNRVRLGATDLRTVAAAMEVSQDTGVGTFHLPDFGNIKVKFDKESGGHYIWAELL